MSIDKNRQGDYHLNIWKNELKIKCKQLINIRLFPEVIHIAEHRRIHPRKKKLWLSKIFKKKYNAHVIYRGYCTCSVLIYDKLKKLCFDKTEILSTWFKKYNNTITAF